MSESNKGDLFIMPHYPTTFAERERRLPANLSENGNAAREALAEKGFHVVAGLTRHMARYVGTIARQRGIVEYCPKEPTEKRFGSLVSTEKWLGKKDPVLGEEGRGMFLLVREAGRGALHLAGYGWTGPEKSEKAEGGATTFAVRIREEEMGQGLAAPFTQLIVDGSAVLYGARDIWLETWKSNHAGGVYEKVGFVMVHEGEPEYRPTLQPVGTEINGHTVVVGEEGSRIVKDTRVTMSYPNELLPAA